MRKIQRRQDAGGRGDVAKSVQITDPTDLLDFPTT